MIIIYVISRSSTGTVILSFNLLFYSRGTTRNIIIIYLIIPNNLVLLNQTMLFYLELKADKQIKNKSCFNISLFLKKL